MSKDSGELMRLRKELVQTKAQVADLQEELEEKTNLYIKAISVSMYQNDPMCRTETSTERS
jgi:hypothetical protein